MSTAPDLRPAIRLVADTLVPLEYTTWSFGDSVAFEAMIAASEVLEDDRWSAFAHGWARAWASRALPYRELDCTAPGWAIVDLARRRDDPRLLAAATGLAEFLAARPTIRGMYRTWCHSPLMAPYGGAALSEQESAWLADPPPGSFVDCLHFDPPFFAALGAATGQERWLDLGVAQAVAYVRALQRADGLFDHFVLDGVEPTFGQGWGRGQGWALLGLLDVLAELAAVAYDPPEVAELRAATNSLVTGMVRLQRPDGHWYAVVDNPASGDEYSTAAFMAAGFSRAVRQGVVDAPAVAVVAEAATRATVTGLRADGTLANVSAAVMACTQPSHYAHVPRGFIVPWGQGPALLALAEQVREEQP